MNKNAFTLVELSIVLVIIGLLTGGLVGGQSLVHSAKVRAVASDFSSYQVAYITFVDQYNYPPGDMPDATSYWPTSGTADGNGNGNYVPWYSESEHTWTQFVLAEMLNTGVEDGGGWYRESDFTKDSMYYLYSNGPYTHNVPAAMGKNVVVFARRLRGTANMVSLSAVDANLIDRKLDDGLPNSGGILGVEGLDNDDSCIVGVKYKLSGSGRACQLMLTLN